MTSKEWRSFLRSQAKHGRPDDIEEQMLADYEAKERECEELKAMSLKRLMSANEALAAMTERAKKAEREFAQCYMQAREGGDADKARIVALVEALKRLRAAGLKMNTELSETTERDEFYLAEGQANAALDGEGGSS